MFVREFIKRPTQFDDLRITLLGAPGSGKGTQGSMIAVNTGLEKISTGDMLREEISMDTDLGKQAVAYTQSGDLVPDDLVLKILLNQLLQRKHYSSSFMLDGFPRNKAQALALDRELEQIGEPLTLAIYLEAELKEIRERLKARLVCSTCHALYNIYLHPPKQEGVCDRCQSKLQRRADDDEKTIRNRLNVFQHETMPVVDFYKDQGKLVKVQAHGRAEDIAKEIHNILQAYTDPSDSDR